MKNLSKQRIFVKGKRVEFDSLPSKIKEKLLKQFKDDRAKNATNGETKITKGKTTSKPKNL